MRISPIILVIAITLGFYSQSLHAQTQQDRANIDRWTQLSKTGKQQQVIEECTAALNGNINEASKVEIHFVRALAGISSRHLDANSFVESFIRSAPRDERGGELLFRLARAQNDLPNKTKFYTQAVQQYPGTYWAIMSKGALRQADAIGKPFDLDFTDAINGNPVSVQKDLKGKVVVIDFWATWCSDCAAELPHMMSLYAKYKNQGVEFVGVSLDEAESLGGLKKLRDYVKTKGMNWPQYYQGDKFDSQFSSGWGVSSTPTVFILDKQGRLHSTQAGGKLDELIPMLLDEKTR